MIVQWAQFAVASLEPDALALQMGHADGSASTPEGRAGLEANILNLRRPLAYVERHLATEGHPVGRRFTVADINLAEVLRYAKAEPGLLEGYPEINQWLQGCQARPAFQAMWAARSSEPA